MPSRHPDRPHFDHSMNPTQLSRSGPKLRALLRPRLALVVGGTLLVAALTLPSRFDEAFETIATHGDAGKARPAEKRTSSVHGAIAGAVPKYDGTANASNWWGDAGAPFEDEAETNYERSERSSGGSSWAPQLIALSHRTLSHFVHHPYKVSHLGALPAGMIDTTIHS